MQTFIALSGNLTRASVEVDGNTIPLIGMTFEVMHNEPIEIMVEEPALHAWLTASLDALEQDLTAEEETAEIMADPEVMAVLATEESA